MDPDRARSVTELRVFLDRAADAAPDRILDHEGLSLAAALASLAHPDDVEAWHLIASLHWRRYLALPQGDDRADFQAAIGVFTRFPDIAEQLVPEAARSALAHASDINGRLHHTPDEAETLHGEAVALLEDPRTDSDIDALRQAIALLRRAVALTPADASDHGMFLSNLGNALRVRFERSGSAADLDEAVAIGRAAVDASAVDSAQRALRQSNLGLALRTRFERTGARRDLDEAVKVGRAAAATAADTANRAVFLSNLGSALRTRYEHTGELADLNAALDADRAAADSIDPHTNVAQSHRAAVLANLGLSLQARFERLGTVSDLDEAIEASASAVAATPDGHASKPVYQSGLSGALWIRFEHTGRVDQLDEAIDLMRAAVAGTPTGRQDRAAYLANLAVALRTRYEHAGREADLDQAIEAGHAAVAATDDDHPDLAMRSSNLGVALLTRFEWQGSLADLDDAVQLGRQAVAITAHDHPGRAGYLSNVGNALLVRFRRTGMVADLDEAIDAQRAAVARSSVDDPRRAGRYANLARALKVRASTGDGLADLDEAVKAGRAAVAANPPGHPDVAMHLSGLGDALRTRSERTGNRADLDEAIEVGHQAVATTAEDHPGRAGRMYVLAGALLARHERAAQTADWRAAADLYRKAAGIPTAPPMVRAWCARGWATLAAGSGRWREVRSALRVVFDALPQVVDQELARADRRHHLGQLQGLGSDAARAWLSWPWWLPPWRRARRTDQAWIALEAGRGVLMSQALDARGELAHLRRLDTDLADEVQRLRALLNRDTIRPPNHAHPGTAPTPATSARTTARVLAGERQQLIGQWRDVRRQVQSKPGLERFGLPPTVTELRAAVGTGTVVAINASVHGCHALLLTARGSACLPLGGLNVRDIEAQATRFLGALPAGDGNLPNSTTMTDVLAWLWDTVAGPVLEQLRLRRTPGGSQAWPRIWWIPTGLLARLPIHAAGHHHDPMTPARRTVIDRVISSYTPTVRALREAARPRPRGRGALVVGVNATTSTESAPLPSAAREATTVTRWLGVAQPPLLGAAATRDAVAGALPTASWVHLACHAYADPDNPAESHVALYDGRLTVRELNTIELGAAHLVYLSACDTATGSDHLPDEVIHVASAFHLAGFAHAIATTWPVPDRIAWRSANLIYGHLRDGLSPAVAVHRGVRTLRERFEGHPEAWASHIHLGV